VLGHGLQVREPSVELLVDHAVGERRQPDEQRVAADVAVHRPRDARAGPGRGELQLAVRGRAEVGENSS
jgi:hypothetical protein